jgi:hypothetical protein
MFGPLVSADACGPTASEQAAAENANDRTTIASRARNWRDMETSGIRVVSERRAFLTCKLGDRERPV